VALAVSNLPDRAIWYRKRAPNVFFAGRSLLKYTLVL